MQAQPPPHARPPQYHARGAPLRPSGATTVLIVTVLGFALSPLVAPVAFVLARNELRRIDAGQADPSKRQQVHFCKIVSLFLMVLGAVAVLGLIVILALTVGLAILAAPDRAPRLSEDQLRGPVITVGQSVDGRLTESDRDDVYESGTFADTYQLELEAGDRVAIDLVSEDFDPYLGVVSGTGEWLASNDDHGESRNSHVVYVAPVTGRYFIAPSSFSPGQTGSYRLTVSRPEP